MILAPDGILAPCAVQLLTTSLFLIRLPVNGSDPATALMAKKAWLAWLRDRRKREKATFSDERLAKGDL